MSTEARDTVVAVGAFLVLCAIAIGVGAGLVAAGEGLSRATLLGAFTAVLGVVAIAGVYRMWARVAWGAPFVVGDTVLVTSGAAAGELGRVVSLGQGLEVEVEVPCDGSTVRISLPWRQVRRKSPRVATG